MRASFRKLAGVLSVGFAIAVLVAMWAKYRNDAPAASAAVARDLDVQRELTAQFQRFAYEVSGNEYAPEWRKGVLEAVKSGNDRLLAGDFNAAAAEFEAAISADPNSAYLLHLKGSALLQAGDAVGAAKYFDTAVFVQPDYAWGYYELAVAQCSSGNVSAARESVFAALTSSPSLDRIVKFDPILKTRCPALVE